MITISQLKENIKELEEVQETCKMIDTIQKRLKKHIKDEFLPEMWSTNLEMIKYELKNKAVQMQVDIYNRED